MLIEFAEVRLHCFEISGFKEGRFDHALAIIKAAVDFQGGDVATQCGELFLLQAADLA